MRLTLHCAKGLILAISAATLVSCDSTTPSPASQKSGDHVQPEDNQDSPSAAGVSSQRNESFENLPAPYSQADYSAGRRTFKLCSSCHTVVEDGIDLVGPNLHGIFGREAGSLDGFSYSQALQEADFVWTPDRLEQWLANPRDFLPGNKMSFAGVRRPDDRHAVIAYLMVESGYEIDAAAGDTAAPSEPSGESNED